MTAPALSILLVNYNGKRHLDECLGSVFAQDWKDFEVVLVDNASADGSAEYVAERWPAVKLVRSGANLGFAGGNNLGFRHCSGRWIFFLNNDTRLAEGALSSLARGMAAHPDCRVFAAFLISYADRGTVDSAGDTVYRMGGTLTFSGYPVSLFRSVREVTSPCGGAAIYAREVLDRIGLFDEDFFLNMEDLDLGFRARHAGERALFLPDVKVYHKGSATLGGKQSALSIYYAERNYPLFLLKNWPLRNLVELLPGFVFIKALRLVSCLRWGRLGSFLRGNFDALRLAPRMFARRRAILGQSKLGYAEFRALLRPGFLRERWAFKRGRREIAP